MKLIITGCAGFVGSNLSKWCIEKGHDVIGIDNLSHGFLRNIEPFLGSDKFTYLESDVCNYETFASLEFDCLIHLASQKIPRYTNALATLEENNTMIHNVIRACIDKKAKLVFSSTSDVYGKNPELPFSETSNFVLGESKVKRWSYALSKIFSEHLIIANNDEYGMPYTIVRFFGSYGPNQNLTWWGGPQSVFIEKALKNEEIEIHGDGMQTRTFSYVEETVEALYECIINPKAKDEIFNIASNPSEEVTIIDLAKLIWKLVNGPDSVPRIKFISYETFGRYEDVRRRVPDITKLKEVLDIHPKLRLEEGLKKTIVWQKQIMNL